MIWIPFVIFQGIAPSWIYPLSLHNDIVPDVAGAVCSKFRSIAILIIEGNKKYEI